MKRSADGKDPEMKINGLQKLTLLDYPGHTACTVFLAGCDMDCPFCHNSDLITGNAPVLMDDTELMAFLRKRKGILDGVAFTGGEPLLRKDLPELMARIKEEGFQVKLDTNGNHPKELRQVLEAGLADYVAMDVKNSVEQYALTAGVKALDISRIQESIALLIGGKAEYEFRTTVIAQLHDAESFRGIGPMIEGAKRYFLQAFADRESVRYAGFTAPSKEELEEYARIVQPFVREVQIRGI